MSKPRRVEGDKPWKWKWCGINHFGILIIYAMGKEEGETNKGMKEEAKDKIIY